jgi:hypothetical protein
MVAGHRPRAPAEGAATSTSSAASWCKARTWTLGMPVPKGAQTGVVVLPGSR